MAGNEWALIVFTVVMQMAVGSFVFLGGVHFFATRRNGIQEADKLCDRALLAIGPAVALAMLATLFHLGNPLNAPRAIVHLGSSWLSREIVLSLAFVLGGAAFALLQWRKVFTPAVRNLVGLAVAAIGLVLVYAMSKVYRLPVVPAWDTRATPVTFFITTFLLGAMSLGTAFVANYWFIRRRAIDPRNVAHSMLATSLRWFAVISIALLGLQFLVIPLHLSGLAAEPTLAAAASLAVFSELRNGVFVLRLLLLFLGAGLLSVFVYAMASSESRVRVMGNTAQAAFAMVLVSEILGRYLFYAAMVRVGL